MEVSPILVPILGLMIPIVAIVAKTMVAPWMELQRRRLDIEAQHTAEKAANMRRRTNGWKHACACWNGSPRIAAPPCTNRSRRCATTG